MERFDHQGPLRWGGVLHRFWTTKAHVALWREARPLWDFWGTGRSAARPSAAFWDHQGPRYFGASDTIAAIGQGPLALWNHLGSRRFWAAVSAAFGRAGPPLHSLETHVNVNTFNIWPTVNPFNKSCPFFAGERVGGLLGKISTFTGCLVCVAVILSCLLA